MDALQITLIIFLIVLVANITAVSVYLILLLKDLRVTIQKTNEVVDNVHNVTSMAANPVSIIAGIINGAAESFKAVKSVSKVFSKER